METAENIVIILNEILEADHFDPDVFSFQMKTLKELCNPSLKFLDFEYHNERLLRKLKKEKIGLLEMQDFEAAAKIRENEKECMNYISIRKEYCLIKSAFYLDQNFLFYFYLGTSPNDKIIRNHLLI